MSEENEFYAALKDRAYECNAKEFKELLLRFGDDPRALKAIQSAVNALSREEDRGSYCENATPGWNTYVRKTELLKDCRLGTGGFEDVFNRASAANGKTPKPAEATVERLCELVEDLSARIEKLEKAAGTAQDPLDKLRILKSMSPSKVIRPGQY